MTPRTILASDVSSTAAVQTVRPDSSRAGGHSWRRRPGDPAPGRPGIQHSRYAGPAQPDQSQPEDPGTVLAVLKKSGGVIELALGGGKIVQAEVELRAFRSSSMTRPCRPSRPPSGACFKYSPRLFPALHPLEDVRFGLVKRAARRTVDLAWMVARAAAGRFRSSSSGPSARCPLPGLKICCRALLVVEPLTGIQAKAAMPARGHLARSGRAR